MNAWIKNSILEHFVGKYKYSYEKIMNYSV